MTYYNMAAAYKNRIAEPLYVRAAFSEELQHTDIALTTHKGQECDLVISGRLKVQIGAHSEVLSPGDCIYYDSSTPHGMIAVGGNDCEFYAIVLNPSGETETERVSATEDITGYRQDPEHRIYENFILPKEDENGALLAIDFKNEDTFNFAFDVVDVLGKTQPEKLAMLHIAGDKTERRFTFADMRRESSRTANYFKSLGIKKAIESCWY